MSRNWQKDPPETIREIARDVMPLQVATDMLCSPIPMSGRDRKMYRDSREKHYCSIIEPKPREEKLAFKLKNCSWVQLTKWLRRTSLRRKILLNNINKMSEKVNRLPEGLLRARFEKELAMGRIVLGNISEFQACLENEHDEREARASAALKIPVEEVAL